MVKRLFFAFSALCGLSMVLGLFLLQIPLLEVACFILFGFFCLFGSGYLLARKLNPENSSELYTYIIALGIICNVALYMVCYGFRIRWALFIFLPITSLAGLIFFIQDMRFKRQCSLKVSWPLLTAFIFVLTVSFFSISMPNASPSILGGSYSYVDSIWNIGNINSLVLNFPPKDIRMSGLPFQYHYLPSMFRAIVSIVAHIRADRVFFVFTQFISIPFMVFSLDAVAKKLFKNHNHTWTAIPVFYFSICASSIFLVLIGPGGYFSSVQWAHYLPVPNGMDFATPFSLAAVLTIIKLYASKNNNLFYYASMVLFVSATTFSKGPVGILLAGMSVGLIIVHWLQKKKLSKSIFICLGTIVALSATYLLAFDSTATGSVSKIDIGNLARGGDLWPILIVPMIQNSFNFLESMGLSFASSEQVRNVSIRILSYLYIPIHFIGYFPFVGVPFLAQVKMFFKKYKTFPTPTIIIIGMAGGGIVLANTFAIEGIGQRYFILGATAYVVIAGLSWISEHYAGLKKSTKKWLLFSLIVSFSTTFIIYTSPMNTTIYNPRNGLSTAWAILNHRQNENLTRHNSITNAEYEAMLWLQENTSPDCIIATDRHYYYPLEVYADVGFYEATTLSRYFYYSAYSGRQMFLESWGYMNRSVEARKKVEQRLLINESLYIPDNSNRVNIMKEYGIDYLIISHFIHPVLLLEDQHLTLVFSNQDIQIYQLSQ